MIVPTYHDYYFPSHNNLKEKVMKAKLIGISGCKSAYLFSKGEKQFVVKKVSFNLFRFNVGMKQS